MTNYEIRKVNWDELVNLSNKINNELEIKNIKIDTLVPLLRGGMPLSLLLTRFMPNADTTCLHIRRSASNKTNSEFGTARLRGLTNEGALHGKNILIVEDIIDKGDTLDLAIKTLKKYKPNKIYIATFFNFNNDKYKNAISGEKLKDIVWILFPWEVE